MQACIFFKEGKISSITPKLSPLLNQKRPVIILKFPKVTCFSFFTPGPTISCALCKSEETFTNKIDLINLFSPSKSQFRNAQNYPKQ